MDKKTKQLIKDMVPAFLLEKARAFLPGQIYLKGSFSSWAEAQKQAVGYNEESIVAKVKEATLKVKRGEVAYERDSVTFNEIDYSFPVLAALLRVAVTQGGNLSVLDFGGSLGSSYFQCRSFLTGLKQLTWAVVEQEKFVSEGRENFEDNVLKFYFSIDECLASQKPNVALFSSVMQYLEKPFDVLDQLNRSPVSHLIVDMIPFHSGSEDVITIQHVPEQIYSATYPMRLFSKQKFMKYLTDSYTMVAEFNTLEFPALKTFSAEYRGLILERK